MFSFQTLNNKESARTEGIGKHIKNFHNISAKNKSNKVNKNSPRDTSKKFLEYNVSCFGFRLQELSFFDEPGDYQKSY